MVSPTTIEHIAEYYDEYNKKITRQYGKCWQMVTSWRRTFDWDGVLDRLRQKGWNAFIRTRSETDKDSLLAQRERYNLQEVGLKVVQEESFYVEPRLMAGETDSSCQKTTR
jgi:phage host-nuclease inhibitor protein Gam